MRQMIGEINRIGAVGIHDVNLPVMLVADLDLELVQNLSSIRRPSRGKSPAKVMVYGNINRIRAIWIHDVDATS